MVSRRPGGGVDVAVQVHGVGRHPRQRRVSQDEHRAGVADGRCVLLVESRQGEFFARVEVVVAEDEQAFARAAGEVELQSAVFPPGVGMGDVAQADDRVAGSDTGGATRRGALDSCA